MSKRNTQSEQGKKDTSDKGDKPIVRSKEEFWKAVGETYKRICEQDGVSEQRG